MTSPMEDLRAALDRLDHLPPEERREARDLLLGWIENQAVPEPLPEGGLPGRFGMIGDSAPMQRMFELLAKIVRTDVPVLVLGESGTGKELVARALHEHGPRRRKKMFAVNCAAIPGSLLEAELFGHVKGAFTGAHRDRKGYAEEADGGTLFLDEIGEMPLALQSKLLRFLQDGEVRPVGGNRVMRVDARVIAATNQDLHARVRAKEFREDLYYRLAVITLEVPPLRERPEDVPHLVRGLLARHADKGLPTGKVDDAAMQALQDYDWPGNVRQLENALLRAASFASGGRIKRDDLSAEILETAGADG